MGHKAEDDRALERDADAATPAEQVAEDNQDEKAAEKAAKDVPARKPRAPWAAELSRRAGAIVLCVLLVAASVAAVLVPAWGIDLGTFLGGGNQVTLTLTASDGSDLDASAVARNLSKRAGLLVEKGVTVKQTADNTLSVRVPASEDAATAASALAQTGKVEFVRVDSISDADTLAQLTNSAQGVELKQGTYTAFATSDNIKGASVVASENPYAAYFGGDSMVYAVSISLDSAGADALASATDELSSTSGKIALVEDGVVIAAPSVSKKIEGGEVTVSAGLTQQQAYALAARISAGPVSCTFETGEAEGLEAAFGSVTPLYAAGLALVASLVAALACARAFGAAGWIALPGMLVTLAFELGLLTILNRFELVILGTPELIACGLALAASAVTSAFAAARYSREHKGGSSLRKAQQAACADALGLAAKLELAGIVVCCVVAFFTAGGVREFLCALAAGLFADILSMPLVKAALLRVLTAKDADTVSASAVAAAVSAKADPAQVASEGAADPADEA